MDELADIIRLWSARARWQSSLYWVFFGLTCGLVVALVLAIAARIFPVFDTTTLIALAVLSAVAGAAISASWPWIRTIRYTRAVWARRFDAQFMLKERLSTANELREGVVRSRNEHMVSNQREDAVEVANHIDIKQVLPFRAPPRHVLAAICVGLAVVIIIMLPNPQQQVLADRAQMQQVEQEHVQQLEQTKQAVQQSKTLTDAQKKQISNAIDDAEKALSDPNGTPEKALAAINDAQSKLDAVRDPSYADQREDLQRAGQSLAPDDLTNPLANALENGNFQQAADQMRSLAQNNGKSLTAEQRKRIADQLDQIARNIQNSNSSSAQQLRGAAQDLRTQQDQAAQTALNQVADNLEQTAQKQSAEQQLSEMQASIEDTRRDVSEAAQKSASAQAKQLSQGNQPGANGGQASDRQPASSSQNSTASSSQQQSQANGQNGAQTGDSSQADAGQNGPANGQTDNTHHEDSGSDNSVMVPGRISGEGQNVSLPDDKGTTVANPDANASSGISNQSSVPYQQVYAQYAKTADDAIQGGTVPSNLRGYVHDYFSSLDPRQTK